MSYGGPSESPEADNLPPYIDSASPPSPDAETPPPLPDTETPPPTPDTETPPPTPDTETLPPTPDTENPPPTPDTENPLPPYPYPSLPPTSDAENSPPPSRPEPIPSSSGSRSMPTTSTVKIVVPVVALLLVIIVSLVVFLVIRSRRRNAANDAESQQQQTDNELPTMEWSKRIKIALGSAKGLAYLHEDAQPQTIHRDIKASNILLDLNFEPKVSDFGLAKEFPENLTHVSTRIMGTFGYLAPEYASSGKLTFKSDVFSFGVVLLELITGRKPIDITTMELGLVQWAKPLINKSIQEDDYDEIVDPRLQHLGYNKDQMRRMVACAAACLRQSADSRPKMSLVMKILANDVSVDELRDSVIKSKIYTLSKKFN